MVGGVWRATLMDPAFGNPLRERASLFLRGHFLMRCEVTDLCTLKKQINETSLILTEIVVLESPVELRVVKIQDPCQQ
jgi:hypothetical protein